MKEHEFVEFYSKIYVLDNGERKKNPPYVAMSSSGGSSSGGYDSGCSIISSFFSCGGDSGCGGCGS